MNNKKLRGKDLKRINYSTNRSISMALGIISKYYKHNTKDENVKLLKGISDDPEQYLNCPFFGLLAEELLPFDEEEPQLEIEILKHYRGYRVFGKHLVSDNTMEQMEWAMRLPVTIAGALMPDAHQGYGLPIGGVLATTGVVIPYGVGLDIGCRMSLGIYNLSPEYLKNNDYKFKMSLKSRTNFGSGGSLNIQQDHPILDRPEFQSTHLLKQLHGKAVQQLGTSGSGNHFVEFGVVELGQDNDFGLDSGQYVGLLAHSGSRGFGAAIAKYYTNIAKDKCYLPRQVQQMAWLDLNSQEGQEYWLSMNLAGDYATACHDRIHANISEYLGIEPIAKVENHHNFAWKETHDDQELIVHRKGATPAAQGQFGIIPGSMATEGFIVKGKGNSSSLQSAAHGAGRKMSRKSAKDTFTKSQMLKILANRKVALIGGGVDEAPIAYKDINDVMNAQKDLVDVIGKFTPRIVRMDKS